MGRPEAALKEMEAAHRADPNNLKIVDALAKYYQELGQFQRAQELYQEALTRHGSNRALQNNYCYSFLMQGNPAKAEVCFQEALGRDPGNIAVRNNLGLLWCRQGKLAEAQRLWEEAEGVAGAQNRMNQAMAFLGKAPVNYAKSTEAKPQPPAAAAKPAAPVKVASLPKAEPLAAPKPAPAAPVKAEAKQAAKAVTPAPKPAAPVKAAASPAPRAVVKQANKPVQVPAVPAATAPKVEKATMAKPAESKPATPPQAAAAAKPAAPVKVASLPKAEPLAAPKPAPAAPAKVEPKQAAKAKPDAATTPVKAPPAGSFKAKKPKPELKVTARAVATKPTPAPPPAAAPKPAAPPVFLTVKERADTGIEVRNGTWTKDLARETRTLLSREGYNVALIGNHIDFGVESTVIYYRPGAEKVAQALTQEVFPEARLEQSSKLKNGVDVKVLLGRDLMAQTHFLAKLGEEEKEIAPPVAPLAKPQAQPGQEMAAEPPRPKPLAAPPQPAAVKPTVQDRLTASAGLPPSTGAERQTTVETAVFKGHLTAEELINTAIEIRNGTWTRDLARETRTLLSREGYNVALIGNHIDFGAEHTMIYYRPEAERVAQSLNSQIFPGARMTPTDRLNQGTAIKVVLGYDLLERPRLMSQLVLK